MTIVRTHTLVGFANPHLICDECKDNVRYWHDPIRCGSCTASTHNSPCGHTAGVTSKCPTWNIVDGCTCTNKEEHDKP